MSLYGTTDATIKEVKNLSKKENFEIYIERVLTHYYQKAERLTAEIKDTQSMIEAFESIKRGDFIVPKK